MGAPALIFDLDGTLVDSVYQHVLAWHEALQEAGVELAVWRIGMSGGLLTRALLRETGRALDEALLLRLQERHTEAYRARIGEVRALPGARRLLARLSEIGCAWAIATSGRIATAGPAIELLGVPEGVPIVTRDRVPHAKPDPDLFLEAMRLLGVDVIDAVVVGDSVWDMLAARRARMLGIGLLSGGYGTEELERAGAYRVYDDPADLLDHLDEIGVRPERMAPG
jgi:HAD superfamily hydrolase (TIGR01509 family)